MGGIGDQRHRADGEPRQGADDDRQKDEPEFAHARPRAQPGEDHERRARDLHSQAQRKSEALGGMAGFMRGRLGKAKADRLADGPSTWNARSPSKSCRRRRRRPLRSRGRALRRRRLQFACPARGPALFRPAGAARRSRQGARDRPTSSARVSEANKTEPSGPVGQARGAVQLSIQAIPNLFQAGASATVVELGARSPGGADGADRLFAELDDNAAAKEHDVR